MKLFKKFMRLKQDEESPGSDSKLARVLTTFDLVCLGVGSTLGVGIYVLAGEVAKTNAGPATIISFLIAAVITACSGLCFAEFGARFPKAGSAYAYSYYLVGELVAFVIGWSLILEYIIGAASVAKGISSYIDSLFNHVLSNTFTSIAPLDGSFLASYVDFFAMSLCLLFAIGLSLGVKDSSFANRLFSTCNLLIVIFVVCTAIFKADLYNWQIPASDIPIALAPDAGKGGFAPFGFAGIINGAAICFYGFIGFDSIATASEEVLNPQQAIPRSIFIALTIVLLAYIGVSTALTLMVPYYLLDVDAPIPNAFDHVGWSFLRWIVGIGALFGLIASLFGALFPLPRILYAMANDGLLYRWLGAVNPRFKTPLKGTLVAGVITSILAAMFNLQQLIGLNAIGTLLTYALVSVCVIVLRFKGPTQEESSEYTGLLTGKSYSWGVKCLEVLKQLFSRSPSSPSVLTSRLVNCLVFIFCILAICLCFVIDYQLKALEEMNVITVGIVASLLSLMMLIMLLISWQPSSDEGLAYKMPLVPLLPCFSIVSNVYLMIVLDSHTWIRYGIFMAFGMFIYLSYGLQNSEENQSDLRKTVASMIQDDMR